MVYYAINVGGLAVGMTSFLIILIYCFYELSFDNFHTNNDRIVRVVGTSARTPNPLASSLIEEVSGVETATRVIYSHSGLVLIDSAGNAHEEKGYAVDSTFFDVFSFPFLHGISDALHDYKSIVVTERFARKVFGESDAVGKFMRIDGVPMADANFRIAAVIATPPANSQFDFDILTRYNPHSNRENWDNNLVYTYVLLSSPEQKTNVQANVRKLFHQKLPQSEEHVNTIELQSLREQHFDSSRTFDFGPHTKIENVYALISVALLILGIACINFINLSTAKATDRRKEVGMRKISGATRKQLILQFLSESLMVTLLAFTLACITFYLISPTAQTLTGLNLVDALQSFPFPLFFFLLSLPFILGMIAGIYPAMMISSFDSIQHLTDGQGQFKKSTLRKMLVSFQFGITAFLFIGTLTIMHQFDFINSKNLGFDDDQVVVMNIGFPGMRQKMALIRNELVKNPNVVNVSGALTVPGDLTYTMPYSIYDTLTNDDDRLSWAGLYVDPEFVNNMTIEVKEGRSFSSENSSDSLSFLMNETAAEFMVNKYGEDWRSPIGKTLNYFRSDNTGYYLAKKGTVIGVVKDFNYYSLHQKIDPLVIQVDYRLLFKLVVKVRPTNIEQTLAYIQTTWERHGISKPFNYVFLDDHFGRAYEKEAKFKQIFTAFSVLSIIISCCGLYGLVLYAAEKRTREMSIRKILGAHPRDIIALFTWEFFTPIMLSFFLVGPVAWWAMTKWLEQFAYHITLEVQIFLLSAVVTFSLAFLTIFFRTLKIVRSNPCESLNQNK